MLLTPYRPQIDPQTQIKKDFWSLKLGAHFIDARIAGFKVWAPFVSKMELKLFRSGPSGRGTRGTKPKPAQKSSEILPMTKDAQGYFQVQAGGLSAGDRYYYVLDGIQERPDPVSRFLPEGVHGPTAIVNPNDFTWTDGNWRGLPHQELIFYELHVGAFTPEGTFESAVRKLSYLKKLGVTCVELMPIFQFPGKRNWGYDGASLYAVQNSYGGPNGLKKFVNACHKHGLAVCLDVLYNHLGPEGNYLREFGPYFTHKYKTPWGDAINYDGCESDNVRQFFIDNALYWISEYHADALRLDATEWMFDIGPRHILSEIRDSVKEEAARLGREVSLIAESDLNNPKVVLPKTSCGFGMDAQWSDDFHHCAHALLTGEKYGYYMDFSGLADLAKALKETNVYDGKYSPFRKRKHGVPAKDVPGHKFVVCLQNHDQIGNRACGDRLCENLSFEALKLSAALLFSSPYLPLIFMGQEYAEKAPFQYFVDHTEPKLIEAVRKGRREEFAGFGWGDGMPDPKSEETFLISKLRWDSIRKKEHRFIHRLYRDLIASKRSQFGPRFIDKRAMNVSFKESDGWLAIEYPQSKSESLGALYSFSDSVQTILLPFKKTSFRELLNTENKEYGGSLKNKNPKHTGSFLLQPKSAILGRFFSS